MGYNSWDTPQEEEKVNFGTIEMVGKEVGVPSQKYNRIACTSRGELLLLSVIGESHNIKRMRACLLGGAKVTISAAGAKIKRASDEPRRANQPGRVFASEEGYEFTQHKLGYGMAHALFMTRMLGFMKIVNPKALWRELKDTRFTTPILPEWMPYIEEQLRKKDYLTESYAFGCECGVLTATTKHLDEIVEFGIKSGKLTIPSSVDLPMHKTA